MSDPDNALLGNIKKKGENSYYYAHAPRPTDNLEEAIVLEGEGIITGGNPVLIKRQDSTVDMASVSIIRNYSWADSDEKVSVYIQFDHEVDSSKVTCDFQTRAFTFTYTVNENEVRKLCIRKLCNDVDPDKCAIKYRRQKVIINLHKASSGSWYKLNDN
jgi:hypothetical protein